MSNGNRKVLIVAYLFPPIGGIGVQRALKFAKYLSDHGWTPIILTTHDAASATMDAALLHEISDIEVIRVSDRVARLMKRAISMTSSVANTEDAARSTGQRRSALSSLKQWLKGLKDTWLIPDEQVLWAVRAAMVASALVRDRQIDCVFSTSSPVSAHLVGWLVKRWTNIPWVADFRDPWTDNMHYQGTGLRLRIERYLERGVMENATAITTVTDSFKAQFGRKYPRVLNKISVIRNGVDPDDFPNPSTLPSNTRFTMLYAGILYPKRSPQTFLKALSSAIRNGRIQQDEIRVEFAGVFDYPGSDSNRRLVEQLHLQNVVKVLGYLSHDEIATRMADAHSLLLIGDKGPSAHMYVPGKLYEYLYVERHIFGILEAGEASDMIAQYGAGVVVAPDDVGQMEDEIVRMVERYRLQGMHFAKREIPDVITRPYQAGQLAQLLSSLCGQQDVVPPRAIPTTQNTKI